MHVPRALEKAAALTVGIVDGFDRVFDSVDRALGQLEKQAVVLGLKRLDRVERLVDAAGPAARLPIFHIAARGRRPVDRLP